MQENASDSPTGDNAPDRRLSAPTEVSEGETPIQDLARLPSSLAEQKHYLKAVVDSTEDALIAFDAEGRFSLCNRAFEGLFGLCSTDLHGLTEDRLRASLRDRLEAPDDFFEPSTTTEATSAQPSGEQDGTKKGTILRWHGEPASYTSAPQTVRVLRWSSTQIRDENHTLQGHIATVRDITREHELDRMKTDFVSIVSHELRTPMTSIKGYVDLILDGDTGQINDLQREFLSKVQRNTDRLVALVNDMLDISRIESGRIEFDLRTVSLADLITQAVETMEPTCAARGLTLEVSIHPPTDAPPVLVDSDRVVQVLLNLLSNAIKYTLPPPQSTGRIEVTAHIERPLAFVTVRDSGIGISTEDQALLFEKFFRAGNRDTRQTEGTGLGLPISKALIEKMGGELWLDSTPGEGSAFTFTLPVDTTHKARSKPRALHQAPRVLIAYDDPDGADALSSFIKLQGYATENAYSGIEAMRLLEEVHFDAVMVRLLLPGLQGFELLGAAGNQAHCSSLAFEPDGARGAEAIHSLRRCTVSALDPASLTTVLKPLTAPGETLLCVGEIPLTLTETLNSLGMHSVHANEPLSALVLLETARDLAAGFIPEDLVSADIEGLHNVSLVVIEALRWDEQTVQLVEAWDTVPYLFFDREADRAILLPPSGEGAPQSLRSLQHDLDEMAHRRLEEYSRQSGGFGGL